MNARTPLVGLAALGLLLGALGSCTSDDPVPEPTVGPVSITRDVQYAKQTPDLGPWSEPVLDVYAPTGADGLPLVVILPPHGMTKDDSRAASQLADALASRGAVAVVANWSQQEDPPEEFSDAAVLEAFAAAGQSMAACAVGAAVQRAAEYGADPSRLVIVGELYGANTAAMVALGSPEALSGPGCLGVTSWAASGLVAINGDWVIGMPDFDGLEQDADRAVEALSPWASLGLPAKSPGAARGQAPAIPVRLVLTKEAIDVSGRCGDRDADWMVWRDPSEGIRAALDEVGAYDDGCVDLGDSARALAGQMQGAGLEPQVVELSNSDGQTVADSGAHFKVLGPADRAQLADLVMGMAG
jgi:hypothetical protein